MTMRVVAAGRDTYWLSAIQKAMSGWAENPVTLKCSGDLLKCISSLPDPDPSTILLADASGQSEIEKVVATLREMGWRYVIVVAADPSAKEATAILRRNLGYDYWEKTYDEEVLRTRIKICFNEITKELPPMDSTMKPSKP